MDSEAAQTTIKQAFELWITPEVVKRQTAGTLPAPFELTAAQVLFSPEGPGFLVRLNDEVRGVAWARAQRAVEKGDPVLQSDLEHMEVFDIEGADLDHGHLTIFSIGGRWLLTFNFLRKRAYCTALLEKAKQFLAAARFSVEMKHNAPAVDNLFSATELISRSYLIMNMIIDDSAKTHGNTASALNKQRHMGNIDVAFTQLFNKLSRLRQPARYNAGLPEGMDVDEDEVELVGAALKYYAESCEPKGPPLIPQAEGLSAKTINHSAAASAVDTNGSPTGG